MVEGSGTTAVRNLMNMSMDTYVHTHTQMSAIDELMDRYVQHNYTHIHFILSSLAQPQDKAQKLPSTPPTPNANPFK